MDWYIDPLLSITKRMMGGVIFVFTKSGKGYDSF